MSVLAISGSWFVVSGPNICASNEPVKLYV
jgi:hypothetical protein